VTAGSVRAGEARHAFERCWEPLAAIGRDAGGGYHRLSFTRADLAARAWFTEQAAARDLALETDRNGNQWAWWGQPGPGAVVTGSHLDSVPGGGAYDGPLGVVSAFLAVDRLRESGARPVRPIAVVNFTDEEGGRFAVACVGSRLLTGALDPSRFRDRRDADGVPAARAYASAGIDPDGIGADPEMLARIGVFVELHVEQGRSLVHSGAPVGVAAAVWPHGRWRLDLRGVGNHAGTTALADRHDPVLPMATAVLAARAAAEGAAAAGQPAVATVGRVTVDPGAMNGIAERARLWLDARAPREGTVRGIVARVERETAHAARAHGVAFDVVEESWSGRVDFGTDLRTTVAAAVAGIHGAAPILPTGAGHDAAVLAAHVPSAMLFVRNPTGVSHSPAEHADPADCVAGVTALTAVLEDLACR
jgi:beta-ureidopropionase / N-carbamoyl-L-amino-acid hydrolase